MATIAQQLAEVNREAGSSDGAPMFRQSPTATQLRVLRFIATYGNSHDLLPTSREIAEAFGIARATADGHIRELVAKGQLAPRLGRHRNIVPTAIGHTVLRCSSGGSGHRVGLGRVYAGKRGS